MARQRFLITLRWSDMDAYGHVNNVQFLRLLEDARVLAFHGHDPEGEDNDLLSTGLIVARHEIDYLTPLHYRPDPVAIDLWVSSIAGAHFDMDYEVLDDGGRPVVYARAQSTMVAYTLATGRPRRFTSAERELLRDWQDAPIRLRSHRRGRRGAQPDTPPARGETGHRDGDPHP